MSISENPLAADHFPLRLLRFRRIDRDVSLLFVVIPMMTIRVIYEDNFSHDAVLTVGADLALWFIGMDSRAVFHVTEALVNGDSA